MQTPFAAIELSLRPFGQTEGSTAIAALAFLGLSALLIFGTLKIRRAERAAISPKLHGILTILRGGLLVLLVLFLLFQPQVRSSVREVIPSYVLVALDTSGSMAFRDAQMPDLELVEQAAALGLRTAGAKPDAFKKWLGELHQGSVPGDPAYRPALEELRRLPRAAIADTLLKEGSVHLLARLRQDRAVRTLSFAAGQTGESSNAPPAGETDLSVPLTRAGETGGGGERCVAVVLLTDGRQTREGNPLAEADGLKKAGIPVFPIVAGSAQEPPDLAVIEAKAAPPVAFRKSQVRVQVLLKAGGLSRGSIKLKLVGQLGGKPLSSEQAFPHDGKTPEYTRVFEITGDEAGRFVGEVVAEWDGPEVESVLTNNRAPVRFQFVEDKAKVLIVDSEMRYETHYMQTALQRDESIQLRTVILDPPRINALSEEGLKEQNYPESRLPSDFAEFMAFDCIIVGDVDFRQLTQLQRQWFERYVTERGGTIVFAAGKKSMPSGLRSAYGDTEPTLAKLLPISRWRTVREDDGFAAQLTAEGNEQGYLQLASDGGKNSAAWDRLPKSYWAICGKCKASAVPLAFLAPKLEANVELEAAKPGEIERDNAVLVRQNIGFGKTLFLGLDSTWRWRYRTGDAVQFRFWGQLIRWAASDRPLSAGNEFLRFGAREPSGSADRPAEVVVRFTEQAAKAGPINSARVRIREVGGTGDPQVVVLKQQPTNPLEWRANAAGLKPGQYELEPVVPGWRNELLGADGKPLRASFEVVPPLSREDRDLSANYPLMRELAERTGGKAFWAREAAELPDLLKDLTATRETVKTWTLSDSWWLFGILLALLTAEWSLRKWAGLA